MIFLSCLLVLVLIFWWGLGAGVQRDAWILRWIGLLQSRRWIADSAVLSLVLVVVLPGVLLALFVCLLAFSFSSNWLFFVYVPVLFYCVGRGDLRAEVNQYLLLVQRGDTVAASHWVDEMRTGADVDALQVDVDDWQKLHTQALEIISYRSYERLFAVLFWFFILGAVGALIYRLSVVYSEQGASAGANNSVAKRWLRLIEWPGVRMLGLTWALVGNFDSCFAILKNDFWSSVYSSAALLSRSLRGALGMTPATWVGEPGFEENNTADSPLLTPPVISGITTEPDSLGLIPASLSLFSRALLLWVCFIALVTLTV